MGPIPFPSGKDILTVLIIFTLIVLAIGIGIGLLF